MPACAMLASLLPEFLLFKYREVRVDGGFGRRSKVAALTRQGRGGGS